MKSIFLGLNWNFYVTFVMNAKVASDCLELSLLRHEDQGGRLGRPDLRSICLLLQALAYSGVVTFQSLAPWERNELGSPALGDCSLSHCDGSVSM